MTDTAPALSVRNLHKSFGPVEVRGGQYRLTLKKATSSPFSGLVRIW